MVMEVFNSAFVFIVEFNCILRFLMSSGSNVLSALSEVQGTCFQNFNKVALAIIYNLTH